MKIDATTAGLIESIYGELPDVLTEGLRAIEANEASSIDDNLWSEQDVVLITYADQIRNSHSTPLQAQRDWLLDEALEDVISIVHLLPFCPYTSDDGFSVVDYLAVDEKSGSWADIGSLGQSFDLMFDLVLNHASQKHAWFQAFLAGEPEFADFFIDQDPTADLSAVVRPRSLPLLTEFTSPTGIKTVWTTFSSDQVDLNYANPRVMLRMLETLVEYSRRGARIIRLDAIAFLWKEVGTNCLHHAKTHAVVKLMRRVLEQIAPGTILLTETNVPHRENISYFGDGHDEAQMVYQFSLPPLLLDAIHSGETTVLRDWMKTLKPPSSQTTYFNFTASHDGIGVRPLEGIVSQDRVDRLVDVVGRHGGRVSMRTNSDGSESPYELNIAYIDAVADRSVVPPAEHSRRFLATQAIMMSIQGVPAIYFHSLVGSPNDQAAVEESGQNRRINRHKYERDDLDDALSDAHSLQRRVFDGMRRLVFVRRQQMAFHPGADQQVLELPGDGLLGFLRIASSGEQIAVLANLTAEPRMIDPASVPEDLRFDELAVERLFKDDPIPMRPFQVRWLTGQRHSD